MSRLRFGFTTSSNEVSSGLVAGAVAGGISTLAFTVLHHVFISPIWWMLPVMLVAGAACGACLAWSYRELVSRQTRSSWWRYVALSTGMFGLLALASVIIYEPIINMTELFDSTAGGNPIPISETTGLMVTFTLAWSGGLVALYRKGWREFGIVLTTTTVVMLFLGFNVSTIGLVEFPTEAWILLAEFFAYIAALGGVYGLAYSALMRWPEQRDPTEKTLSPRRHPAP